MIKHIKKKTVNHISVGEEELDNLRKIMIETPGGRIPKLKFKDVKDSHAFLVMDSGEILRHFFYNDNGNTCTIPLANPVLIYFHTSQANLKNVFSTKKDLLVLC
jgi:hypothetical protein